MRVGVRRVSCVAGSSSLPAAPTTEYQSEFDLFEAGFVSPVNAFAVTAIGRRGVGGGAHDFFFAGHATDFGIEVVSGDVTDRFFVQEGIGVAENKYFVPGLSYCAVDGGGLSSSWSLVEEADGWKAGDDGGGIVRGAVGHEKVFDRAGRIIQADGVGDLFRRR